MQEKAPQPLFDHARIAHNRARFAARRGQHNVLFLESAEGLLERLSWIKRDFKTVLDLGSRDGYLAAELLKSDPTRSVIRLGQTHDAGCVGSEEFLPFGNHAFDLILSNLSLHWVNDLPGALIQARRALKPDGFFLAALLGGETLHELRTCLYEAETQLRGGISPRVGPFMDARDGASLLQRAGFALPVASTEKLTFSYPDIFALMRELRFMGEGYAATMRDKRIPPRELFNLAGAIYQKRFPSDEGIRATFETVVLSGWAAHESQQIPLQPGQATQSLAEALRTVEMITPDAAAPLKVSG